MLVEPGASRAGLPLLALFWRLLFCVMATSTKGTGPITMDERAALDATMARQLKQARASLELLKQPAPSTFCGNRLHPPPMVEPPLRVSSWVDAFKLYPWKW
jgi:hypothetical protein